MRLADLPTPSLVLDRARMTRNIATMHARARALALYSMSWAAGRWGGCWPGTREQALVTLYRGMDRAALDAAYNNSLIIGVAKREAFLADWQRRSEALHGKIAHAQYDLRYGPAPRQRLDWYPAPGRGAPTLLYIHGGYWQGGDKVSYEFLAPAMNARGLNLVNIEYTLGPDARMIDDNDQNVVVNACREHRADVLIAGGRYLYPALKSRLPFLDINHERDFAYAGYTGMVELARQLACAINSPIWQQVRTPAPWSFPRGALAGAQTRRQGV